MGLPQLRFRQHVKATSATPSTPVSCGFTAVSATITASGTTATIVVPLASLYDQIAAGDSIEITEATDQTFNGKFIVQTATVVSTDLSLTVTLRHAATGSAGSPKLAYSVHAQKAIFFASPNNLDSITLSTWSYASGPQMVELSAGQQYVLEAPHGAKFDLAGIYVTSETASQTVNILFI